MWAWLARVPTSMILSSYFSRFLIVGAALSAGVCYSQQLLTVPEQQKLTVKRGETAVYHLKAQLKEGYHANSNTPNEAYLIPLKLTWEPGLLEVIEIKYPPGKAEKYEFSEKPLSVVSGDIDIATKFKPAANANLGPGYLTGKLRYQACNDKMCFPPKSVEVKLPVLLQ